MFDIFRSRKFDKKPVVVLLVLDGFGVAPPSDGNAIFLAKTPNYDKMLKNYPHGELIASGESVGLPANEVGNTEVGHLTLGAGRTMYQDLVRIDKAIEEGSFYENKALLEVANYVKQRQSKLHIMGLASTGSVHSSYRHLEAMIDFCQKQQLPTYLHLFLDGRDADPKEGVNVVARVEEKLKRTKAGVIASLTGRYYAMDRDRRWDRTQLAYEALTQAKGLQAASAVEAVKASYLRGETDEFVKPTVIVTQDGRPTGTIDDNDGVVFFNFRTDRPKQLTGALVVPHFEGLKNFVFEGTEDEKRQVEFESTFVREKKPQNTFVVTMTQYAEGMPVQGIAFGPEVVEQSMPEVLAQNGKKILEMAESEKERFVTYYFNGMREELFEGVEVKIVPSPKVATYDTKPEMSVYKLLKAFKNKVGDGKYDFMCMNFANPDMVAHSGDLQATVRAVEHVDKVLGEMERVILQNGGLLVITADHGNAEELLRFARTSFFYTTEEGDMNTGHSNNKVPVVFVGQSFAGRATKLADGVLADVAPTLLKYMGLPVPEGMTGKDLLGVKNG